MLASKGSCALAAGVALSFALAGCGDDEGGSGTGSGGSGTTSTSSSPTSGPSGPGGTGAGSGTGSPSSSGSNGDGGGPSGPGGTGASTGSGGDPSGAGGYIPPPDEGPPAGNPDGSSPVPEDGQLEDSSTPRTVVGDGTPASCTSDAFVGAVANGGVITFDCGPDPVTIVLNQTAKVFNDTGPEIVIDGGGLVTLSGANEHRILYQNTCDELQVWTTPNCDNQDHPRLTVQNLTFVDATSVGEVDEQGNPEGGGAIFARGGRLKIINSRFFRNRCDDVGPDVGGAAVRAFDASRDF